jgi:protein required for attachment to host cells
MKRACIAIVDASRARLFAYQHTAHAPNERLREVTTLVSSGTGSELAQAVVAEIDRIVREHAFGHVVVVASPEMLVALREVDGVLRRDDLILDEIARDLAKLTSSQLHDHLARIKLIPSRELAFAVR